MPRRLVQIWIDGYHVIQCAERPLEPAAVWCGEHGVAGDRDERAARGELVCERATRKIAADLGQAANRTSPSVVRPAHAESRKNRWRVHRRRWKHHRPDFVDVTRYQVERLCEPARQRSQTLRAEAY